LTVEICRGAPPGAPFAFVLEFDHGHEVELGILIAGGSEYFEG